MLALEAEWLKARAQMLDPPVRPLHPLRVPMSLAAQGRLIVWPLTLGDRKKDAQLTATERDLSEFFPIKYNS